jgi:hypothetical protein
VDTTGKPAVKVLTCVVGVIVMVLPLIYSLSIDDVPIVKADVINLYTDAGDQNKTYAERGELISRTGAWVSALIIIFTVIIGVTKKRSR